jgi:hypothetical protein
LSFNKQQIEKHFNIEIHKENEIQEEEEKPSVKPVFNRGPRRDLMVETITCLREKATLLPFSEIDIRLIIHDGRIKRVERTIVENYRSHNQPRITLSDLETIKERLFVALSFSLHVFLR